MALSLWVRFGHAEKWEHKVSREPDGTAVLRLKKVPQP
jgi:hypothetical protein